MVSATDDRVRNTIGRDRWDHLAYEQILERVERLPKVAEQLADLNWTAPPLLEDIWQSLFQAYPRDVDDVDPAYRLNQRVQQELRNTDGYRALREHTVDDATASAIGTLALQTPLQDTYGRHQAIQEKADEAQRKLDEYREALAQAAEADGNHGDGANPEGPGDGEDPSSGLDGLRAAAENAAAELDDEIDQQLPGIGKAMRSAAAVAAEKAGEEAERTRAWGLSPSELAAMDPSERLALASEMHSANLIAVAEKLGQLTNLWHAEHENRFDRGPDDLHGIEVGDDLPRLLQNELANLTEPALEDLFYVRLAEKQLTQYCVDAETEIFTRRGWLRHDQLLVGDETLGIDEHSGTSLWQQISDIYRGAGTWDVVRMKGRSFDAVTTPGHRWLVRGHARQWRWTTTATMNSADAVPLSVPRGDSPVEAVFDDAFVELVAWFWTEGSVTKSRSVQIGQSHREHPVFVDRIERCFRKLYGEPGFGTVGVHVPWETFDTAMRLLDSGLDPVETARRLPVHVATVRRWAAGTTRSPHHWRSWQEPHGMTKFALSQAASAEILDVVKLPTKEVRAEFLAQLTQAQLDLFIATSIDGDGTSTGQVTLGQSDEGRIRGFQAACALAGRATSTSYMPSQEHWKTTLLKAGSVSPVAASRMPTPRALSITTESYNGTIWCPTVPYGNWLARRNGSVYFTGNSLRTTTKTGRGGIHYLDDSSLSMSGDRMTWSKALGLALERIAREQNREFCAQVFGGTGEVHEFPCGTARERLAFAGSFLRASGTCFMGPLDAAVALLEDEYERTGVVTGDIVLATDGDAHVTADWLAQFRDTKERLGFNVYGVAIGQPPTDTLCSVSDYAAEIADLISCIDIQSVFRKL